MPEHPFHVAGGFFAPPSQAPKTVETFAEQLRLKGPAEEIPTARAGSRRRKLWDIPHKFHCPVIGVCFGVDELRGLMAKNMQFPRDTSDFVLHTTAVGACETRTPLAESLHKQLEKRFARCGRMPSTPASTSPPPCGRAGRIRPATPCLNRIFMPTST